MKISPFNVIIVASKSYKTTYEEITLNEDIYKLSIP